MYRPIYTALIENIFFKLSTDQPFKYGGRAAINSEYTVRRYSHVEHTSSAMSLQAVLVHSITDTFMTIFSTKTSWLF